VIERDYILRLIKQVVEAVALILRLSRSGRFGAALEVVRQTIALVLGPDHALLERMDPASVVNFVGKFELDRVRLYAVLLAEEGAVHELRGDADRANRCRRRALELYAAGSLAGARLDEADRDRIVQLLVVVDGDAIDSRYREQLDRLARDM
jgi:hypothetical protein